MGRALPPDDASLYRAVSDILLHEWDPLGVSEYPEAADEYHAYLPEAYRLVKAGAGAEVIADYLLGVERGRMAMHLPRDRALAVARTLADLVG